MPTYEYRCDACGRTFDHFQSMNDPRLETCILDDCEGTVKRLLGKGAGIIFKGSGFYQTDYRSESYKKGAESASKSTSDSKSDKSDKSDSGGSSAPVKESGTKSPKPAESASSKASSSSSTSSSSKASTSSD